MRPETGNVVVIRHYSMINVFYCMVIRADSHKTEVKLPKECMKSVFLAGDPLALAYETNETIEVKGGKIIEFKKNDEALVYSEDTPEEGMKMRSYERFPVSLYADYRVVEEIGNKKRFALIKDISEHGLMIYSKDSHFKALSLNLDIYLARDILSLTAQIVRVVEHGGYTEYGLKIRHNGPYVLNQIKNYIRKSQAELKGRFTTG